MKNMGNAFLECICTLRVDSSLLFHKSWLSPTRLHSDPVLEPGPSKLEFTKYDLTSPSNSGPSYSRRQGTLAGCGWAIRT